jgi:hypothetical protein
VNDEPQIGISTTTTKENFVGKIRMLIKRDEKKKNKFELLIEVVEGFELRIELNSCESEE